MLDPRIVDWLEIVRDIEHRADEEAGKISPSYRGPVYWKAYREAFNRLFSESKEINHENNR